MKHRPYDLARLAALTCTALAIAACGHGSSPKPAPVLIATGTAVELEPNDSAFDANFLGRLDAGGRVRILGRMSSFDAYDGFAFVAGEPLSVRFVLSAANPGADLDVCIYDPYLDEFVACFEAPGDLETGVFDVLDAGAEFHVVVVPFAGVSDYELDIFASCCSLAPQGLAPEDANRVEGLQSARGAERLRGYAKSARAGDAAPDDDEEATRVPALVIEVDAAGRIEAAAVELWKRDERAAR